MKKTSKQSFLAGCLALSLLMGSGTSIALAKGKDQLVQEETQVELIEMIKSTDEDFSDPFYTKAREYRYVNEAGEERWYISYLKEIDGYVRTGESREFVGALLATDENECAFEGDYVYNYYDATEGYCIPLHSKKLSVTIGGKEYLRTKMITSAAPEVVEILLQTGVYRVTDNIMFLATHTKLSQKEGGAGMVWLELIEVMDDKLITKYYSITDNEKPYQDKFNGFLINPLGNKAYLPSEIVEQLPEEERIVEVKRDKQLTYHLN